MNPYEIIDKYYPENTQQRQILVIHSLAVSGKAMKMLDAHPELRLNRSFVKEAALLHDIGIFQTRWKISLPSNFPFLIARCCPSPWKNN